MYKRKRIRDSCKIEVKKMEKGRMDNKDCKEERG